MSRRHRSNALEPVIAGLRFHTLGDVAEILKGSERTVHRWVKAGHLPAHGFGRAVRISQPDLQAFIASRRTGGMRN